jgi:NDP-sugar pyrophosphorylase family protein
MTVQRAMLMAAGLGTRLRPFTDLVPKALMPVMGIPVAQFALDSIGAAGVKSVVVNIHHHAAKAREGFMKLDRGSMNLSISDESELLLGSAGGLRKALPLFEGEPFFLVNADVLCDIDLRALALKHEELRSRWNVALTLAVFPEPPTSGKYREIFLDAETGLVTGFSPDLRSGRPFFIGSAVLETDAFKNVPMSGPSEFVPTILEPMIRERRVGFHLVRGSWKDIGSPELWLDSHLFLIRGMETGKISKRWQDRIEKANRRIASETWVSRWALDSNAWKIRAQAATWGGPCYFSGEAPPRELGPSGVLYDSTSISSCLSSGIGLGGKWMDVSLHS